jgi:ribosomal protein S18 acetylase RimI-like enzyme
MGLDGRDGGFIITATENGQIKGCVVINDTGMAGYIPEHILVYIAVHRDQRGKGLGKKLMAKAIKQATRKLALHVEHDNPAKRLYERIGFTNKYLEMRLIK